MRESVRCGRHETRFNRIFRTPCSSKLFRELTLRTAYTTCSPSWFPVIQIQKICSFEFDNLRKSIWKSAKTNFLSASFQRSENIFKDRSTFFKDRRTFFKDRRTFFNDRRTFFNDRKTFFKDCRTFFKDRTTLFKDRLRMFFSICSLEKLQIEKVQY